MTTFHIEIWQRNAKTLKGVGGDADGDEYNFETNIIIVRPEDFDNFQQSMISEYESRDYSFDVRFTKIASLSPMEFELLKKELCKGDAQ